MQTPDKWVILKVQPKDGETFYRLLSGWYGGYLTGNSWKLNSGITKVEIFPEYYDVHGESGSVYRCYKEREGFSMYTNFIYGQIVDTSIKDGCKVRDITFRTYKKNNASACTLPGH